MNKTQEMLIEDKIQRIDQKLNFVKESLNEYKNPRYFKYQLELLKKVEKVLEEA